MKPLVWVHSDGMSPFSPAFRQYPGAPAVFVLDPDQMQADDWTLQRAAFLYQSALELPCEVRAGDTTAEILWAARAHNCDSVVTIDSPDPDFRRVCNELRKSIRLEILQPAQYTDVPGEVDLRRFSGYWKSNTPHLV